MSVLQDAVASRELLLNLTMREVRGRYKRTLLGNLWSLINPLATMLIYTVVFGLLLRVQVPPGEKTGIDVFALWLLCGLVPWTFFSGGITAGLDSVVGNANLVKKVYFPREVLVGSAVLALGVTFCTEMLVLVVALLLFGSELLVWIPLVLVFMLLLLCFALGLGMLLAVANVYFRDTRHFTTIALQVWFYLTPILYPLPYVRQAEEALAERLGRSVPLEQLWGLNPVEHFVSAFRAMLYDNVAPAADDVLWCVGAAAVSLVVGTWVFRRRAHALAEEL
ncbi:ABC transporter permease [Thalassiella azotivora]